MDHDYQPAGFCPKCNYATDVGTCPECGHQIQPTKLLKRPSTFLSRNWKKLTAMVLVTALYGAIHFGYIKPIRYVPSIVLMPAYKHLGYDTALFELTRRHVYEHLSPDLGAELSETIFGDTLEIYSTGHICSKLNRRRANPWFLWGSMIKNVEGVFVDGASVPFEVYSRTEHTTPSFDNLRSRIEQVDGKEGPKLLVTEGFYSHFECRCRWYGSETVPPPHLGDAAPDLSPSPSFHLVGLNSGEHAIKIVTRSKLSHVGGRVNAHSWTTEYTATLTFDPALPRECNKCLPIFYALDKAPTVRITTMDARIIDRGENANQR